MTLLVLRRLARGWVQVDEVSADTGVHRRVVYRVLATLRAVGLTPAREARGAERYWRLSRAAVERWLWR